MEYTRFEDLPVENAHYPTQSSASTPATRPSSAPARPPARPAQAFRTPPVRAQVPAPVRQAPVRPAAPARTAAPAAMPPEKPRTDFAKRSVCAFREKVPSLEACRPGQTYILVVTCEVNKKGFDDDLILHSISEAPDLAVLAAKPATRGSGIPPARKGSFQSSGGLRYDRRDADPGANDE